jgi:predicted nucleic acid-binding protein
MAARVVDCTTLQGVWQGRLPQPGRFPAVSSVATAQAAAARWLKVDPQAGVLTPIILQFLNGLPNPVERPWAIAFLNEFPVWDSGRILPADWREAERLIQSQGGSATRSPLDALILAICLRLRIELIRVDPVTPTAGSTR